MKTNAARTGHLFPDRGRRCAPPPRAPLAAFAFFIVSLLLGLPSATWGGGTVDAATEAYENGNYAEALKRFETAAQGGDARAQEVLGFMYLNGKALYGDAIPWNRERAVYWFGKAAQQQKEVAQHMLCVLTGQPGETVTRRSRCVPRGAD
jgi:TPR repeat protein